MSVPLNCHWIDLTLFIESEPMQNSEQNRREALANALESYIRDTPFEAAFNQQLEIAMANGTDGPSTLKHMSDFFDKNVPPEIKRRLLSDIDDMLSK